MIYPITKIKSSFAYNETNLMHCLSSVYSVTIPLHVSGLLVAHHQEVTMYIYDSWYVLNLLSTVGGPLTVITPHSSNKHDTGIIAGSNQISLSLKVLVSRSPP